MQEKTIKFDASQHGHLRMIVTDRLTTLHSFLEQSKKRLPTMRSKAFLMQVESDIEATTLLLAHIDQAEEPLIIREIK